jgi:peptide-methionine (S)-S-oxide reductase
LAFYLVGIKMMLKITALLGLLILAIALSRTLGRSGEPLPSPTSDKNQTAVFSGGCFWGVDAVFKHVKGVVKVTSGYSGGSAATAHYDDVSTGMTGHAESVEVVYDPTQVRYDDLLKVFFTVAHNPTEYNRQGPDSGPQYRSAIFYATPQQKDAAEAYIARLNKSGAYSSPITTQVVALNHFYSAEGYHQNYCGLHPDNPYIVMNDLPKVKHLEQEYPDLYKP